MKKLSPGEIFAEKMHALFIENWSYKMVALFIAIILWLTILGRRDFVLSKNVDIEVVAGSGRAVVSQSVDRVKVKVSGPRTALKKFMDSGLSQMVTLDASQKGEGDFEIEIPTSKMDVPFGVRVLQIKPNSVRVQIRKN